MSCRLPTDLLAKQRDTEVRKWRASSAEWAVERSKVGPLPIGGWLRCGVAYVSQDSQENARAKDDCLLRCTGKLAEDKEFAKPLVVVRGLIAVPCRKVMVA